MPKKHTLTLIALLTVPGLTGCGPVMSSYLIVSAQAELDGAKAAEAEKYAIYEYTAATEYLDKAREEQGYADFGPSIDYGYKASELAKKARERAEKERDKQRAPDSVPEDYEPDAEPEPEPKKSPKVIIKKAPTASLGEGLGEGEPTSMDTVTVSPETGTRPPR